MADQYYMLALSVGGKRESDFEKFLQEQYDSNQNQEVVKIAVAGWDLSHNAAGRVITLADLYQYSSFDDVSVIGGIVQNASRSKQLWEPIKQHKIPRFTFDIDGLNIDLVLPIITQFVIKHPFDVIHLSKPRITNIILGLLYRNIWNSKVILDIDDEELAFGSLSDTLLSQVNYPKSVKDVFWTQYAVDYYKFFQCITVSNPALQVQYGGIVIPHVRDERIFQPDQNLRLKNRVMLGIGNDDIAVLFFGTPKRHKGLIQTAQVLSALQDPRLVFVIVGDFVERGLKQELMAVTGVRYIFLPNQPYDNARDIVAIGDICILMQDVQNQIAKYQLPAKLIDALAMGLKIFLQKTPATTDLFSDDYVCFSSVDTLLDALQHYLRDVGWMNNEARQMQYEYFKKHFSLQAYQDTAKDLARHSCRDNKQWCDKKFNFLSRNCNVERLSDFMSMLDKNY